jgi:protocatechuate 3,4-dioxygenase beta subunit
MRRDRRRDRSEGQFVLEPGTGDRVTSQKDVWPSAEVVLAVKAGFRPTRFERPAAGWPDFITLRLEGEPLAIRGRVVDPAGNGLPGISILAHGEEILGGVAETPGSRADERTIESLLRGRNLDDLVKTDEHGRFVFGGLLDRRYDLAFFEKETLRIASLPAVAAGRDDLVVVLPGVESLVPVRGRAESADGKPMAGVRITAVRSVGEDWSIWGPSATSDSEGRFELEGVSPEGLWFQAVEVSIDPIFRWVPPPGMALDDLKLTVTRRCHVQIDLRDRGALADSFQVLDEAGEPLMLARWSGSLGLVGDSQPILGGRSEVVAVAETGRTVVLRIHDREVLRLPVRLVPGEIVTVNP